jgi:hypothetical protein
MDRRRFNKLLAGSITAAGIPRTNAREVSHDEAAQANAVLRDRQSSITDIPPSGGSDSWELVVLDAAPPHMTETDGTAAADIDGDGKTELVVVGDGAIVWYRPSTSENGVIALGKYPVGVALEDIDRDGQKEIITGKYITESPGIGRWILCWYKAGTNLHDSWAEYVLDDNAAGHPHDILFSDLDGDGKRELVGNAMYCNEPGLFVYKVPANPRDRWKKQMVQSGRSAEGTAVADLDGDGKEEIICGPYWFTAPLAGAFSGQPWKARSLAPGFREMCRAAIIDVNGDGRLDVILVEDEYPDGRLAWFENRLKESPEHPWIDYPIDSALNFSHSLRAWHDTKTKQVHVLAGEMNQGGWAAPYNWNARLILQR